jgi:hypothetical protein
MSFGLGRCNSVLEHLLGTWEALELIHIYSLNCPGCVLLGFQLLITHTLSEAWINYKEEFYVGPKLCWCNMEGYMWQWPPCCQAEAV